MKFTTNVGRGYVLFPKPGLKMKLSLLFFLVTLLQLQAHDGYAQTKISIDMEGVPLLDVIDEIERTTDFRFHYDKTAINLLDKVSIKAKGKEIKTVLEEVFRGRAISFKIDGSDILLKPLSNKTPKSREKTDTYPSIQQYEVNGTVTDENGLPLAGATILVKGSKRGTLSDTDGTYTIKVSPEAVLIFSYIGFKKVEIPLNGRENVDVQLEEDVMSLEGVEVNAGYYTVKERELTGSISRVTAEEISKQPASNVLGALSGRVPGLTVTQSSGTPGSSFGLQIRGRNSITQGSEPLILIDGIPFAPQNENINSIPSSIGNTNEGGGLSPFLNIDPANIESIEVLKDADATAIYGSRGANGVILITTKKGQPGKTQLSVNLSQGISRASKGMELMNTKQYLAMRREAFENNDVTPDVTNAPDLVEWDQERYIDLRKELIGNTAQVSNAQISLSGGSESIQFLLGGSYHRETNIFPGKLPNSRGGVNLNLNHTSTDERLQVQFSGGYTATTNNTTGTDLTYYTTLPPNVPPFFDEEGNLNWVDGISNPYRYLFNKYKATTGNLTSSLNVSYRILPSLSFKAILGYNELNSKDKKLFPKTSRPPDEPQASKSLFGHQQYKGWNVEPQLEFDDDLWIGRLNILFGVTLQERIHTGSSLSLSGFSSDALLESAQAASTVDSKSTSYTQYRYQALFGRINYNIKSKYILNITGRRDGSSRFGTGQQYANFGAIGAAWIFSGEPFVKKHFPFLSYGKFRGSYGVTGNDQIGDYQYLDAWQARSDFFYQDTAALIPANLYNPVYGWEENKKLEAALELGFWNNRLLLNVDYFRNRSSNQLVRYRMPYTTGFGSMLRNFPALVENKGWEVLINGSIVKGKNFEWNSSLNITFPKNTLLDFPDIEESSYASSYVVGESLNSIYNFRSLGVNPETGLYHFVDANEDGSLSTADFFINGNLDPKYYGGFRNNIRYKGLQLDVFFDYKKQIGRSSLQSLYRSINGGTPGTMFNQPIQVLDRWQQEGDMTDIEKYSYIGNSNRTRILASNAVYSDQSFIRLRSVHLSYQFGSRILSALNAKNASIYMQGQNLITWNKDKGYDPEVQSLYSLAPLKTYTIGIQLTY